MVDARDLKSLECQNSCRFESGSRHQNGNNPESIGVFIIHEIVLERSFVTSEMALWLGRESRSTYLVFGTRPIMI